MQPIQPAMIIAACLLVAFGILLAAMNFWHCERRTEMTQAERDEEDQTAERW
jgi:hypothetical protein